MGDLYFSFSTFGMVTAISSYFWFYYGHFSHDCTKLEPADQLENVHTFGMVTRCPAVSLGNLSKIASLGKVKLPLTQKRRWRRRQELKFPAQRGQLSGARSSTDEPPRSISTAGESSTKYRRTNQRCSNPLSAKMVSHSRFSVRSFPPIVFGATPRLFSSLFFR